MTLYAAPRRGLKVDDCYFYHTMEITGVGRVEGEWELSQVMDKYLGGVEFTGKRVLEIGPASGFLCRAMEEAGADVVSYDLDQQTMPDNLVPPAKDADKYRANYREFIKRLNNSYWLLHEAAGLKSKVVHGTVYDIPEELGMFDVSTLCCVLIHLRDPFLALYNTLRHTTSTVIVTGPQTNRKTRPSTPC